MQSALTYNRQTISGTWWSIRWYHHHSRVCVHTGCLIYHQELKIISLNTTQLTCNREGPSNETSTNDIVSKMTNFIKENSFELTFDGMNIKFTSLQVFCRWDLFFAKLLKGEKSLQRVSAVWLVQGWRSGLLCDGTVWSSNQWRWRWLAWLTVISFIIGNKSQPLDFIQLLGKSSLDLLVLIRNVSCCVS